MRTNRSHKHNQNLNEITIRDQHCQNLEGRVQSQLLKHKSEIDKEYCDN